MADQNKVILEGVVCSEPRTTDTTNSRVMNFRIATQQEGLKWPDRNNVVAWGDAVVPLAEGDRVEVKGKMQTRKWEGRDGKENWTTEVNAHEIKRLSAANPGVDEDEDLPF